MPRPKKGTPESELATQRWRETMQERYGGVTEKMQEIGAIGGRNSNNGGFASKKVGSDGLTGQQRAKKAGKKGGSVSKLKPKVVEQPVEPVEEPKTSIWDRLRVKKGSA